MAFASLRSVSTVCSTPTSRLINATTRRWNAAAPRTPAVPRVAFHFSAARKHVTLCVAASDGTKGSLGYCISLKVGGMVCDGCSSRVEQALKEYPGVTAAEVSLEKGTASVTLSAADHPDPKATLASVVKLVTDMGFEATPAPSA